MGRLEVNGEFTSCSISFRSGKTEDSKQWTQNERSGTYH